VRKVITYGTFDLFHEGHYNILKRAKAEGDYLIVGVTGESYDAERGKLSVQDNLATRIENVKKTGFADHIIVEEYLGQKIPDIINYGVDVLVIGSDWKGKFDHLNKYCEVKYLERTKDISSTQIRETVMKNFKFGIVTDDLEDSDAVMEPKHVSGIHVESVFSEDADIARQFCEKYELDNGYSNYIEFLDSVDIAYIKVPRRKRYQYIKDAILRGKHVISDAPGTLQVEQEKELNELSKSQGVVWLNNITTLYLQAFGQLLWNARGNLIGDLVSLRCSISKCMYGDHTNSDFIDLAYYPICTIIKIFGVDYKDTKFHLLKNEQGEITYGTLSFVYEHSIASAEIGVDYDVESGMVILGTKGSIFVPGDWWRIGYFKIKMNDEATYKRYSFNLDGNGLRYLIQALLALVRSDRTESQRLLTSESETIIELLSKINSDA
jgi:choline-phosphate cytidylyltransferase